MYPLTLCFSTGHSFLPLEQLVRMMLVFNRMVLHFVRQILMTLAETDALFTAALFPGER